MAAVHSARFSAGQVDLRASPASSRTFVDRCVVRRGRVVRYQLGGVVVGMRMGVHVHERIT